MDEYGDSSFHFLDMLVRALRSFSIYALRVRYLVILEFS